MTVFSNKVAQGLLAVMALSVLSTGLAQAADMSKIDKMSPATKGEQGCALPKPGPEAAWLQQLVGNWTSETEATYEPGKPAEKTKGTEMVKAVGGFWVVDEVKGTMMGKPFTGLMSTGYDPKKQAYTSTWIDSMTGKLWEYEGTVDPAGKVLTLETEGECPMNPGKTMKFKETLELKDKNHKVFTSYVQGDDGQWMKTMTSTATRK